MRNTHRNAHLYFCSSDFDIEQFFMGCDLCVKVQNKTRGVLL